MCAGTVVEPAVAASAASVSVTSRSRSVAFSDSRVLSARTSTLPRIGMVLRRSTTRWTWPSDFRSCARSTVTFIAIPARSEDGKAGRPRRRAAASEPKGPIKAEFDQALWGDPKVARMARKRKRGLTRSPRFAGWKREGEGRPRACCRPRLATKRRERAVRRSLALQLPLEGFHLLGECDILGHQGLDLAHGVQDRGVVASAEPAADFRQRAQGQGFGQIHRHLARANDIGGAAR